MAQVRDYRGHFTCSNQPYSQEDGLEFSLLPELAQRHILDQLPIVALGPDLQAGLFSFSPSFLLASFKHN